jgi:hypothetical protein
MGREDLLCHPTFSSPADGPKPDSNFQAIDFSGVYNEGI